MVFITAKVFAENYMYRIKRQKKKMKRASTMDKD